MEIGVTLMFLLPSFHGRQNREGWESSLEVSLIVEDRELRQVSWPPPQMVGECWWGGKSSVCWKRNHCQRYCGVLFDQMLATHFKEKTQPCKKYMPQRASRRHSKLPEIIPGIYLPPLLLLIAQSVKNLPAMQEIWVWFLGLEDSLEKEWQSTPVFLPGKPHRQRSLVSYSPWGHMSRTRLSN